jgi:two-component system, chemotaxis family, chemotaxis protein CheY
MHSLDNVDRNMAILVVDDYPSMRRIVRNCLRQLGFENVTEAEDGDAALQKLQDAEFKFIISDWSMPNMTAGDLLKEVRSDSRLKDVPMLMVAAEQEKTKVPELTAEDNAGVIVKPFTREILQKKMEDILCGA